MLPQAVILAGGRGMRLQTLTKDALPKPLVSVAGQPFLYWQLRYLREQGISQAVLLVAHLGEMIESHFHSHPVDGLALTFVYEHEPLGTGGALRNALQALADRFFVVNGDSFLAADLLAMQTYAHGRCCMATLMDSTLVPVPANVAVEGEFVARFQKGAGRDAGFTAVDAGVYFISRQLVENGPQGRFDLESYWPGLIARRELAAFPINQRFFDIGTPERLKQFEEHVHDYF